MQAFINYTSCGIYQSTLSRHAYAVNGNAELDQPPPARSTKQQSKMTDINSLQDQIQEYQKRYGLRMKWLPRAFVFLRWFGIALILITIFFQHSLGWLLIPWGFIFYIVTKWLQQLEVKIEPLERLLDQYEQALVHTQADIAANSDSSASNSSVSNSSASSNANAKTEPAKPIKRRKRRKKHAHIEVLPSPAGLLDDATAEHFMVLTGVDLSDSDKPYNGQLHFLLPHSAPGWGPVGDHSGYQIPYCEPDQYAFRLCAAELREINSHTPRYEFIGNVDAYLGIDAASLCEEYQQDYLANRDATLEHLNGVAATWKRLGLISAPACPESSDEWPEEAKFIADEYHQQQAEYISNDDWDDPPQNQAGKPFHFIGFMSLTSFLPNDDPVLLMFYDPEERILLFIIERS